MSLLTYIESFEGCIIGGAIGDAWGSGFENLPKDTGANYYWGGVKKPLPVWTLTDDTQLTLATCQAMIENIKLTPELLGSYFVQYYRKGLLTGIGASTLKAILDLQSGIHWSQAGRYGEYAAGNGAAMRIAPLAFFPEISRADIYDLCRVTHRNDEAFAGAWAVVVAIREILNGRWKGASNLIELIIPLLPDTRVRDRFVAINDCGPDKAIAEIAVFGTGGYVVDSVPFAICAAARLKEVGWMNMFQSIIDAGGDTDTNASIAGQVAGALTGRDGIPEILVEKLKGLNGYGRIMETISAMKQIMVS